MGGHPCRIISKRFSIDDEKTKPCKHFIIKKLIRNECCDLLECSDLTLYCITLDFYTYSIFTHNGRLFIIAECTQNRHSIRSDHFCISNFYNTHHHVKIHNKTLSDSNYTLNAKHDDHTNVYRSEIQNGCRSICTNIKPREPFYKSF